MKTPSNKSRGWALILIALGMLAVYGGARWLLVLIPTAAAVWYAAARTTFSRRRNLPSMDDNSWSAKRNHEPAATNRAERAMTL